MVKCENCSEEFSHREQKHYDLAIWHPQHHCPDCGSDKTNIDEKTFCSWKCLSEWIQFKNKKKEKEKSL